MCYSLWYNAATMLPVWTGAENVVLTGIRSPDRQARSWSLYRLRYPAHTGSVGHALCWRRHVYWKV